MEKEKEMNNDTFTPCPPKGGLIGHRGIAAHAPENTLASFQLAAQQGIEWVEFDVRLTKDNGLVIFHDDKLERTSDGKGWVHEHTTEELQALDAGSWFSPRFKDAKIPVFEEILPQFLQLNLFLNIELKTPPKASLDHKQRLASILTDILIRLWPFHHAWPLISSFDWDILAYVRELLPQAPIGFLQEKCTKTMIEMVSNTYNAALHCEYQSLTEDMLVLIKDKQIPVLAYTVNQPGIAKKLLSAGLYGLFSDDPQHLLS
jgi:glycerophosphoryl diester phosphodiesterase